MAITADRSNSGAMYPGRVGPSVLREPGMQVHVVPSVRMQRPPAHGAFEPIARQLGDAAGADVLGGVRVREPM